MDDILGATEDTNVQGETQMKLDQYADNAFNQSLKICGHLCVLASEEHEDIIPIPGGYNIGKYTMAIDPLDGSSNIDTNVSIGTIFSIHQRLEPNSKDPGSERDLLQQGHLQRCAGYIIYGSSTMLVLSTGKGVSGFTLDPSVGEFLLSHPNMKMPESGDIYSANEGNASYWSPEVQAYLQKIKSIEGGKNQKQLVTLAHLWRISIGTYSKEESSSIPMIQNHQNARTENYVCYTKRHQWLSSPNKRGEWR